MPPAHSPRLLALAVAAAAVLPVLVAPPALAEEQPPTGDTVVGELVQGYADPAPDEQLAEDHTEDADRLLSWVQTAPGEAVRVHTEDVEDVETGSTVEVVLGDAVVDETALEGLEPALQVLSTEVLAAPDEPPVAPATAPVNHPVTVVMLQPAGSSRDGTTLAQVMEAVNGPVADFWREQTDGAVRFGTVAGFDWPAEPSTLNCGDPFGLWEEAATRAGWTPGPDKHLLVYVPYGSSGCSYGLGTIGTGSIGSGGRAYVRATATSLIAHEFGHNLGLGHASHLQCAGAVHNASCYIRSYHDLYDVMGISWEEVGSLSAPHAELLGVLPATTAPTLGASTGTRDLLLTPMGARSGTRAVRLTDSDGDVYWLEYRAASGRDGFLGTAANWPRLQTGVLVRLVGGQDGENSSFLLDGTPSEHAWWPSDLAVALPGNTAVTFGSAPFTVRVLETTPSGARIRVTTSAVPHPIDLAYERLGGSTVLGEPVGTLRCGLPDGGCRRDYTVGSLFWSPATGAHMIRGDIRSRYLDAGGPNVLGYPIADDGGTADGTGALVRLQGGVIYWSARTGAHVVRGAILERWRSLGAQTGVLGYPTGDDVAVPGGFKTDFAGGSIYWSPATGARLVRGAILQRYVTAGGPGVLGHPTADDDATYDRSGAVLWLPGGAVFWSPSTGAHVVRGAILERWLTLGGETGPLGYPVGDDEPVPGGSGYRTRFAGGTVYWSVATGAHSVPAAIEEMYMAMGGPTGSAGYPVRDPVTRSDDGSVETWFERYRIVEYADGTVLAYLR